MANKKASVVPRTAKEAPLFAIKSVAFVLILFPFFTRTAVMTVASIDDLPRPECLVHGADGELADGAVGGPETANTRSGSVLLSFASRAASARPTAACSKDPAP